MKGKCFTWNLVFGLGSMSPVPGVYPEKHAFHSRSFIDWKFAAYFLTYLQKPIAFNNATVIAFNVSAIYLKEVALPAN